MKNNIFKLVFVLALVFTVVACAGAAAVWSNNLRLTKENDQNAGLISDYGRLQQLYNDLQNDYKILRDNYNLIAGDGSKAIIIIPGFMASILKDPDIGLEIAYENLLGIMLNKKVLDMGIQNYVVSLFTSGENGVPVQELIPADMNSKESFRDAQFRMMEPIRRMLTEKYGSVYDVLTWQYDWRQDNGVSAQKLEEFINQKGYSGVIFVTHSNGGQVVANYLKKPENRAKVQLFIPIAAPFLGSQAAEDALLADSYIIHTGYDIVDNLNFDVSPFISNFATVYNLLPMYPNGVDGINYHINDGVPVDSEGYKDFLAGFPKTHKTEGGLKPMLGNLLDYYGSMFIDYKDARFHITNFVPTEYIVFTGHNTAVGSEYANGKKIRSIYSRQGDGTVWYYSATGGLPMSAENVHGFTKDHGAISDSDVLQKIDSLVNKYILRNN